MFLCRFCAHRTSIFRDHLSHHRYHSNLSKDFHCGYDGCKFFFKTEPSVRMHIIRMHSVSVKTEIMHNHGIAVRNRNAQLICSVDLCQQVFINYNRFLKHLKEHMTNCLTVKCPVKSCDKKYDNVQSFTGHLSKCHRNISCKGVDDNIEIDEKSHHQEKNEASVENISYEVQSFVADVDDDNDSTESDAAYHDFLMNVANLYLKLESQYLVPASTIQHLVLEFNNICSQSQEIVSKVIEKCLLEENIAPDIVELILTEVVDADPFHKSHKLLNSQYKRKKFYKKNQSYVPPEQVFLRTVNETEQFFHYVPILETLKAMLTDKSLESYFDERISPVPNLLQDFTDGLAFSENQFFRNNPDALRVILYQDSFEIVNPLGSAKKKYKILAVYLSLGNLPSYVRTHINSIQLVALCREDQFDHLKVYGRIVEDLKILETQGIEISPNNFRKGGLVHIAGDNLGSHSLGGFVENFSTAPYCCRFCLFKRSKQKVLRKTPVLRTKRSCGTAKRQNNNLKRNNCVKRSTTNRVSINSENKQVEYKEYTRQEYPCRTIESYKESLKEISDQGLQSHYGIKFDSIFNQLDSYHVCQPGLPPCLGHDVQEGLGAYDIYLLIRELVKKRWFTYDKLNQEMNSFPYSAYDKRDKPTKVSAKTKRIVGGAWQIWCFMKLFPLFVRDLIEDPEDPVWLAILLLIEIMELVCAPKIDTSYLPYLQDLIDDYLSLRVKIFPSIPLRPKHHFLSHYAELFAQFGPLINVWTLRFEGKHTFFKKAIRYLHNFLNVTHSLSEKHELLQSLLRMGSDLKYTISVRNETTFEASIYSDAIQTVIRNAKLPSEIQQCTTVLIKGTTYKTGDAVVIRQKAYQYDVEIGKIVLILVDNHLNISFVLEKCITIFHPIIRFYELRPEKSYECISVEQLLSHTPLSIYQLGTMTGVKLQYGMAI